MERENLSTSKDILKKLYIHKGFWYEGHYYKPCQYRPKLDTNNECYDDPKSQIEAMQSSPHEVQYEDDDFAGKHFAFTGTLLSMTRQNASDLVERLGGIAQSGLNKQTNYLVCGIQDMVALKGQKESSKMRKARELKEKGQDIQIIGEDEFFNHIDDEAYAALNLQKPFSTPTNGGIPLS